MAKIWDRKTKEVIIEKQYKEEALTFLYNNLIGRVLMKIWFTTPIYSKLVAKNKKSKKSIKEISKFIEKNKIDKTKFVEKDYTSFNDFFIREYKPEYINIDENKNSLISPAESKVLAYKITPDLKVKIKSSIYTIYEIVKDKKIEEEFKDGYLLVCRLAVTDYHRYIYIDNGKLIKNKKIKGRLHTVSSISDKYKIYKENTREINYIEYDNLGKTIQIEVGAMQIGKIVNKSNETFNKGMEKGYFEYGGSTIVLIVSNKVKVDEDILENTNNNIETKVRIGEKIGEVKC